MRICGVVTFSFILFGALEARSGGRDRDDNKDGMKPYNLVRSPRDAEDDRGLDGIESDQTFGDGHVNVNPHVRPKRIPLNSTSKYFQLELPPDYNMHELPKHASGRPVEILIQLNMRKILNLDESGESLKVDLEFRIFWSDYKIRDHYNAKLIAMGQKKISYNELTPEARKNMTETLNDPSILDSIWKPNLFFGNLLKVTQPYAMAKPITLKLIPQIGAFEYLTRISVVTDCPMSFHHYPADTQECIFSIRSFSYTQDHVKLTWYKTGVWLHELETSSFNVKVGQLRKYSKIVDDEDPLSDFYEVYEFRINSRRRLSYHILQTYLPSTFYIVITCLCFLLPARYVEARIGIAMTTLLTLTAMFASVRDSTPIVSYVKAIDTWMAGCIMFVFLTLAEFTFMTWLRSVKEDYVTAKAKKTDGEASDKEMDQLFGRKKSATSQASYNSMKKYDALNTFLERFNFPIFIGIMTIYSLIYWAWLLNSADYFNWTVDENYNNVYNVPW